MKKFSLLETRKRLADLEARLFAADRKKQVLFALDCAPRVLSLYYSRHSDSRPADALKLAEKWAKGEIKMPVAKKGAHATHNAATDIAESDPAASAAARAMGHVIGTVHTGGHAIGVAIYGIKAFTLNEPETDPEEIFNREAAWFNGRLDYVLNAPLPDWGWAGFLEEGGKR